ANMFQTIEAQGGAGGPSFLSDHPSPKDRYAKINQEAQSLTINAAATPDRQDFIAAQQRLTGRGGGQFRSSGNQAYTNQGGPAPNTGNQPGTPNAGAPSTGNQPNAPAVGGRVESPSSRYQTVDKGLFTVGVPDNWRQLDQQNGAWFAPEGAYGSANGQTVFTHAVNLGAVQTQARNLQQASEEFIKGLTQGAQLHTRGGIERMDVDGRQGQIITFDNVNEATQRPELVNIVTTQLRNGNLFYLIAVCPTDEYKNYQSTFLTILRSVRLKD